MRKNTLSPSVVSMAVLAGAGCKVASMRCKAGRRHMVRDIAFMTDTADVAPSADMHSVAAAATAKPEATPLLC